MFERGPIDRDEMPGFTRLTPPNPVAGAVVPEFAYCYEGEFHGCIFARGPEGYWAMLANVPHELSRTRPAPERNQTLICPMCRSLDVRTERDLNICNEHECGFKWL